MNNSRSQNRIKKNVKARRLKTLVKNIKFYDKKKIKMQGYRAISTAENAACTGHANLMDNIAAKNHFLTKPELKEQALAQLKLFNYIFNST